MRFFGEKCKVLCAKELFYGVVVLIEVGGDLSVGPSWLGMTLVALVVVEI